MKAVYTYNWHLLFAALTLTLSLPGCATNASAADVTTSSKWLGWYEGLGPACGGHPLVMDQWTFSWMDCKHAKIRVSAMSDNELLLEVNREAMCGWAGWLVALRRLSSEGPVVEINTYQSLEKYRVKEYGLFCVYSQKPSD